MTSTKKEWKVTHLPQTKQPIVVNESGELIAAGVSEDNAQLIVTAINACIKLNPDNPQAVAAGISDLYEACKAQHNAIDILFAKLIELDKTFFPSKSGLPWKAVIQGNEAVDRVKEKV